ncbi:hypothetical protein E2C01_072459 [Portunus trituberculatus]|uniref:Uncharacterized protein n=1 Tax=Portunus trituberculatus TaxID=210409 RepID=A0A5B7I7W1_PORTR|nr:hypothetical protein [Portunus trituberculatus]
MFVTFGNGENIADELLGSVVHLVEAIYEEEHLTALQLLHEEFPKHRQTGREDRAQERLKVLSICVALVNISISFFFDLIKKLFHY